MFLDGRRTGFLNISSLHVLKFKYRAHRWKIEEPKYLISVIHAPNVVETSLSIHKISIYTFSL